MFSEKILCGDCAKHDCKCADIYLRGNTVVTSGFYCPNYTAKKGETKSMRIRLAVRPSLYKKLKTKAWSERTSVNDLANRILQNALASDEPQTERTGTNHE